MRIKAFKSVFQEKLESLYDKDEIESFFNICLENIEKKKRYDLMLNPDLEIQHIKRWEDVLLQLSNFRPIQYIFEKTFFYGMPFWVGEGVLIPRPETEELVEWIIESVDRDKEIKILDIGTGSGCIAISLAKNLPKASVYAMDVSPDALEMAKKNAIENKVEVTFILQDVIKLMQLEQQFDIIVSNPPYVRYLEKIEIKKNVLDFEPHLALFVEDDDALIFYKKIIDLAVINLVDKGMLFFEINQYLGKETLDLFFEKPFENVILKKDLLQNDRMIRVIK